MKGFERLVNKSEKLYAAGLSGIIAGHAYSVLTVREVPTPWGIVARIVKLRNPHGKTEWSGLFGDHSWAWTQEAREIAELVDEDDGAFWMHINDFLSYFEVLAVCHTAPAKNSENEWVASTYEVVSKAGARKTGVLLSATHQCEAYISIQDNRQHGNKGSRFSKLSWMLRVFEASGEMVASSLSPPQLASDSYFSNDSALSCTRLSLQPGNYVVQILWSDAVGDKDEKTQIITHSTCSVSLQELPSDPETWFPSGENKASNSANSTLELSAVRSSATEMSAVRSELADPLV